MAKILDLKKLREEKGDKEARRMMGVILKGESEVLRKWADVVVEANDADYNSCMLTACVLGYIFEMGFLAELKEQGKGCSNDEAKEIMKNFIHDTAALTVYYAHKLDLDIN